MGSSSSSGVGSKQPLIEACGDLLITAAVESSQQSFHLEVKSTDSVSSVSQKILGQAGIPCSRKWALAYNGRLLSDCKTLGDYSVQNNDRLVLVDECFQIFVNELREKPISVKVAPRERIRDVKEEIMEKTGIPVESQRLIFAGIQLGDEQTVADCNIQKESTLHLFLHLRGGSGPNFTFNFNSLGGVEKLKFASAAVPSYRIASHGLNFSSVCKNPQCKANGQWIIVHKGFGEFDIAYVSSHLQCPACNMKSETSTNCGFFMAEWKFEGELEDGKAVERSGCADTHEYYTFKEGDNTKWRYLHVTVTQLKSAS